MEEVTAQRKMDNQRLGAFVTNKWLVGILVGLLISMGGYIFQSKDRTSDAQAAGIVLLQTQVNGHSIEIANLRATNNAQYMEILRRLDRIERIMDAPLTSRQRRVEAP